MYEEVALGWRVRWVVRRGSGRGEARSILQARARTYGQRAPSLPVAVPLSSSFSPPPRRPTTTTTMTTTSRSRTARPNRRRRPC